MKISSKLSELKLTDLNCNVFDVYSYNGLSMQELLCQFFTKINECIKLSNETIDLASWLVNEGLKIEVVEKLMLWLNDGTLENLINVNLFNTLHTKIENINTQLAHIAINVKEFGAKGDGITDDTEAIQNAIDTNKNIIIPNGVYLIDATKIRIENFGDDLVCGLLLKSDQHIKGETSTILKVKTNNSERYSIFGVQNVNNVVIDNIKFAGDRLTHEGVTGEYGYGVHISTSNNITLNNCSAVDFWGDGFFIGCTNHTDKNTEPRHITLNNCYANNNRRQGLSITSGNNVYINGGSYSNTNGTEPASGIDIEPNNYATTPSNITFNNVEFKENNYWITRINA